MFKLQPNPTFTVQVPMTVPGSPEPAPLTVEFRHLSRRRIKTYFEGLQGKTDAEALGEIIVNLPDIDAEYNPASLEALLDNYPAASIELFEAYRRELLEARRKN